MLSPAQFAETKCWLIAARDALRLEWEAGLNGERVTWSDAAFFSANEILVDAICAVIRAMEEENG